jgi:hypothetical protein
MSVRYLLFVDDLAQQRMLFKDAVVEWNENNPHREFAFKSVGSFDEAVEALKRERFDGALFDLRLPSGDKFAPERPLGNALAERGLHENGIPVAIISAKPDEIDQQFVESSTVKVIFKGDADAFANAVAWFGELWPMLESLSAARLKIRKVSAKLFSDRIWPRWRASYESIANNDELTPVLARQFVWHLSEVMGLGGDTSDLWHPLEAWICPPLNAKQASTGDILDYEGELWVVMSPPCDLANAKIDNILLVKCTRDAPDDWLETVAQCSDTSHARHAKATEKLRKMFNQPELALHFLPPLPGDPRPIVVQFRQIMTVPAKEFLPLLERRIGSVTAPFINNLIQRFGAYMSRVGQPNLNVALFPQELGVVAKN